MSATVYRLLILICLSFSAILVPSLSFGDDSYRYVVQPGDTVSGLLYKIGLSPIYGDGGYLQKLGALNPKIQNVNRIFPGEEITLSGEFVDAALREERMTAHDGEEISFSSSTPSAVAREKTVYEEPPSPAEPAVENVTEEAHHQREPRSTAVDIAAGIGVSYLDFAQHGDVTESLHYASARAPSFSLRGSVEWQNGYGIEAGAGFFPGQLKSDSAQILKSQFSWQTQSFEFTDRLATFNDGQDVLKLRIGIERHQLPYVRFPTLTTAEIGDYDVDTLPVGVEFQKKWSGKWSSTFFAHYQVPLGKGRDDGFEFKNTFAVDGGAGLSRNLGETLSLGLYWSGEWMKFNYSGQNAALNLSDSGSNKYFSSDLELRAACSF